MNMPGVNGWTVIGVWYDDVPIVTGCVRGEHQVEGGTYGIRSSSWQGPWAEYSPAEDLDQAQADAIRTIMTDNDPADGGEDRIIEALKINGVAGAS